LPCISQRHNLLDDVLTGKDETVGPSDVYGKTENFEGGLRLPHDVIERKLGQQ